MKRCLLVPCQLRDLEQKNMDIGALKSQGREETGTQMVGYTAVPLVPGQVLISQVGAEQCLPDPPMSGHLLALPLG